MSFDSKQRHARLQAARTMWRSLRPGDSVPKGRTGTRYIEFYSKRQLAAGIGYGTTVQQMYLVDPPPTLSVRCYLLDDRVAGLREQIQGLRVSGVLSFDVLAAHNRLEGRKVRWALPECALDAPENELFALLRTYAEQLEDLWQASGGYSAQGLQSLARWLLQHRAATGVRGADIASACAAFVYGQKQLSLELLDEYEAEWNRTAGEHLEDHVRQEMHARVSEDIKKLRQIVGGNRQWMH